MKWIIIPLLYGLFYPFFENVINWVQMDFIPNKLNKWQLRPSNPASLWHIFSGAVVGSSLYLISLLPFITFKYLWSIVFFCIIGSIIITVVELGCGYFLFYILKIERFWDYSNTKIVLFGKTIQLNYLGLIDIVHSLLWIALSFAFLIINNWLFK